MATNKKQKTIPGYAVDITDDESAEWAFALFSVVQPLPQGLLSTSNFSDNLWRRGRYKGIGKLHRSGAEVSSSFYNGQWKWLGKDLARDLGIGSDIDRRDADTSGPGTSHAGTSDADISGVEENGWSRHMSFLPMPGEDDEGSTQTTHEVVLDALAQRLAGDQSHHQPRSYIKLLQRQAEEPLASEHFAWVQCEGEQWRRQNTGEFALLGLEFLSPTIEQDSSSAKDLQSADLLIFHIGVRRASSALLENLSQSLHRPRTGFLPSILSGKGLPGDASQLGETEDRVWQEGEKRNLFRPLPEFFELFKALVDAAETTKNWKISEGGYLELPDAPSDFISSKPHRSVVALPNTSNIPLPTIFTIRSGEVTGDEDPFVAWAWTLATGADIYYSGIPALTRGNTIGDGGHLHRNWIIMADEQGIASVRTDLDFRRDSKIQSFASTRFVDLLVFDVKAGIGIAQMTQELNEATGEAGEAVAQPENGDINIDSLIDRLNHLQAVQNKLIHFRDTRWFNAIPNRALGTEIWLALRRASGVERAYLDLLDEINLRQNTYTTMFQITDSRERRNREKAVEEEQSRREVTTLLLSVFGVVIGIPAILIDLIGMEPGSPWSVIIAIVLSGVIIGFVIWLLRWKSPHRKRSKKSA